MLAIFPLCIMAQVEGPPSLLLGLTGLTGEKGTIDVALLGEIIVEKQSDLKKEFIKREFYDKLQNRNYVVWEYAYNSLEILLTSKDKQALEKELMEYAANLAFVYAFTETYLQVSAKLCNSKLEAVIRAWEKKNNVKYADFFTCPPKPSDGRLWLTTLKSTATSDLNSILVDLVFDVLRQNTTLKKLGFFQSQLPLGEDFYKTHSQYLLADTTLRPLLDTLHTRITKEVGILIDYYYVIKLAIGKNITLEDFSISAEKDSTDNVTAVKKKDLKTISEDIGKISEQINKSTQQKDLELSKNISDALFAFMDFEKRSSKNIYRVEDLYYLEEKTGPLVVKLVTEYGLDASYIMLIDKYRADILTQLLRQIKSKLASTYDTAKVNNKKPSVIKELNAVDYQAFVEILTHIFELDKATTYEEYLKTLRSVAEIFDDNNVSRLIFNLTDFLEKFTTLDKEKNAISVNVEEIILQLYNKYEARVQNNRVNFYFSIGLNQTFGIDYDEGYELQSDSATLKSLAFAAEKIGVKIKFRDWRKIRSYEYGEYYDPLQKKIKQTNTRKPIVNDVYWLVYGSGILYNITNTTTGKDFTYPIIGTGLGVAFYNSLDLNLFVNFPLVSDESFGESLERRQLYGFSFDIKIGEYITAARKKRAEKKANEQNP